MSLLVILALCCFICAAILSGVGNRWGPVLGWGGLALLTAATLTGGGATIR